MLKLARRALDDVITHKRPCMLCDVIMLKQNDFRYHHCHRHHCCISYFLACPNDVIFRDSCTTVYTQLENERIFMRLSTDNMPLCLAQKRAY